MFNRPIWAYPPGMADSRPQSDEVLVFAENFFGWYNEPYGDTQSNLTAAEVTATWSDLMVKVAELANAKGISVDEIKIVGPSVGPGKKAMPWAEEFYLTASDNGMNFDYINIHSYTTNIGCECNYEQLRDELR